MDRFVVLSILCAMSLWIGCRKGNSPDPQPADEYHKALEFLDLAEASIVGDIIVGYKFNEETEKFEPLIVEGDPTK